LLSLGLVFTVAAGSECADGQCGLYCDEPCQCKTGVPDCAYPLAFDSEEALVGAQCAAYNGEYDDPEDMHWALVVSTIAAPVMAFGIGANDIANSWATSVGSGAISVRNAVMLGAVFEFAGATTLGFGVAKTIQKGVSKVTDEDCWACGFCNSKMGLLVGGTAGALAGASSFLMLATYLSLPVSTTHSIVGGVVGMTMVGAGPSCLNWKMKGGLGGIVASWFISPALSGLMAAVSYRLSKFFIMESKNPRQTTLRAVPFLFGISSGFVILMMMFKSKAIKKRVSPEEPYTWKLILSFIVFAVVTIGSWFFVVPWIRKRLPSNLENTATAIELGEGTKKDETPKGDLAVVKLESVEDTPSGDPTKPVTTSNDLSSRIEDAQTAFKYVLVFIACLECFAHGSNDTANATGPFTAVYNTYKDGLYECSMPETPVWIMTLGGFFLALGVVLYGQNVIRTIGSDIASVDFHKAFWIELAATFAVIFATVMEFPVSTTHCKIGAVVAVGIVAPKAKKVAEAGEEAEEKGVNWGLLFKIFFTWVVTIPVAGAISAAFVAIVEKAMTG